MTWKALHAQPVPKSLVAEMQHLTNRGALAATRGGLASLEYRRCTSSTYAGAFAPTGRARKSYRRHCPRGSRTRPSWQRLGKPPIEDRSLTSLIAV